MTTQTGKPQRAAVLARISMDRAGELAGVGRQEADARALAAQLGWTVAEAVVEDDVSAYKRRSVTLLDGTRAQRVVRPQFRRLLALLQVGEIDGLIVYDLDRVARDPRDLEDLIEVVEKTHVPVASVTGSLRLSTDADVTMARVMVAVANKESRDKSRRIARKKRQVAEQGRPSGGTRPFGYTPDGMTVVPEEARAIRWAARNLIAGATIREVLGGLDRRVAPVGGRSWDAAVLVRMLKNPRYIGLRVYQGEVVAKAVWRPILDRKTWDAVRAALDARPQAGPWTLRAWLNQVLLCGRCGHKLIARPGSYGCYRGSGGCGRIAVSRRSAEAEIERRILDRLSRMDLSTAAGLAVNDAADRNEALAADRAQLQSIARLWAQRQITFDEYTEARAVVQRRIKDGRALLEAALAERLGLLLGDGDPVDGWHALDPYGKRDVALAVTGRWLVKPVDPSRRSRFRAERLEPLDEFR